MELGQWLFQGSETQEFEAEWATQGLGAIAEVIEEMRGDDGLLVLNYGVEPYENGIFSMRTYCGCDGDKEGHEQACPPNFIHYGSGLVISWYKHAGRGITANKNLKYLEWLEIVKDCILSMEDK